MHAAVRIARSDDHSSVSNVRRGLVERGHTLLSVAGDGRNLSTLGTVAVFIGGRAECGAPTRGAESAAKRLFACAGQVTRGRAARRSAEDDEWKETDKHCFACPEV
jgi:hypothetical protein